MVVVASALFGAVGSAHAASPTSVSGWVTTPLTAPIGYPAGSAVTVTSPSAETGRIVKLQRRLSTSGTWVTVSTVRPPSNGKTTLRYTVPGLGTWYFRVYVVPTATSAGALTRPRVVHGIRGTATTLSGWATTAITATTGTALSGSVRVTTGTTTVRRRVELQRRLATARAWSTIATVTTSTRGAAIIKYPAPPVGVWYFRARVVPSLAAAGAFSVPRRVTTGTPLQLAMASGNASRVTAQDVVNALHATLTQYTNDDSVRRTIFGLAADGSAQAGSLTNLDWNPSHDSMYFLPKELARTHPLIYSNRQWGSGGAGTDRVLAVAGVAPGGKARFAAFSGSPVNGGQNANFDEFLKRTFDWLTPRTQASNFKVVVSQMPGRETYWYPFEQPTRNFLAAKYPTVTINGAAGASAADNVCDGAKLAGCIKGADLLIVGAQLDNADVGTVMSTVKSALANGIPVMFLNHGRDKNVLSASMMDLFGLDAATNYWTTDGLQAYDPSVVPTSPLALPGIVTFADRLVAGTITDRATQFDPIANPMHDVIRGMDSRGERLFARPGYRAEKLMVLLADVLRRPVAYTVANDTPEFYRALFTDRLVYMSRNSSTVARNLGNFSGMFPASTKTISATVSTTYPATHRLDYATGLYALPGRPVTLRRTDATKDVVYVGINLQRNTTLHWNVYDRPEELQSTRVPLPAGGTITITSPHGGAIYLSGAQLAGKPPVTIAVSNVITHPILRNGNDPVQVAKFKKDLATTPTNWAVLDTRYLMLHSTKYFMQQSLAAYNGDAAKMMYDTDHYLMRDGYELAGLKDATAGGLKLRPTVATFCTAAGWDCTSDIHTLYGYQHMVSDRPMCGDGCSGNPIDFDWAFEPLGWGESHELGHNLMSGRLKMYGGMSTEVSNNMFPMHKQIQYARDNNANYGGTQGKATFDALVAAQSDADPATYARTHTDWLMFYRQLVEYARHYNANFDDGWELWTLMYMQNRQLDNAGSTWSTSAAKLGFGTYPSFPALEQNDFMLISASRIVGRDMRPMFDLWGMEYSAAASAQVAAYGTQPVQKVFFPMRNKISTAAQVGPPVIVTPSAVYPAGY